MKYTEQSIFDLLNALPPMRHLGTKTTSLNGNVCVFYDEDHVRQSVAELEKMEKRPFVSLLRANRPRAEIAKEIGFRILPIDLAMRKVERDVVIFVHVESSKTNHLIRAVQNRGRHVYWLSSARKQQAMPALYKNSSEKILFVVNALADEESVLCYVSRLKALMHGHAGYQRISSYPQYFHPIVQPMEGDVVCEGGIGGTANTSIAFSKHVGAHGKVVGFEPVNHLHARATERTADRPNVLIENMGLWSKQDEMEIYLAEQVSTLRRTDIHGDKPKQKCALTSVDAYFSDKDYQPSMIKLDIEGAEQDALAGAQKTIAAVRPKLQVCLYHSASDFINIPFNILSLNLGYRLYIGHHTPFMNECLMYATAA